MADPLLIVSDRLAQAFAVVAGPDAGDVDPIVRIDPNIDYDFGDGANGTPGSPAPGRVDNDFYSIVWDGYFTPEATAEYTFYGQSDDGIRVEGFREKGTHDGGLINGGFFVCEPEVFGLIDGDHSVFEKEPMDRLIERGKLASYTHDGYWQSMDSLRDKEVLEAAWANDPPWKVWS